MAMSHQTTNKIMYWNCNGISGKRHHLELLLEQHKPLVFAIVETKIISSISDKEVCCGYTLYRRDRQNAKGRGGGILVGILDTSNIKVAKVVSSNLGEILTLDLSRYPRWHLQLHFYRLLLIIIIYY